MADEEAVRALILTHTRRYTAIDVLDVYKLLHQGVFGTGQVIENKRAAREWLDEECHILTPNTSDPFVESVHPTGEIVRVHLRPYLAQRGSLPKLLDAYIETSRQGEGRMEVMAAWWAIFQGLTAPNEPLGNRFSVRTVALVGRVRAAESWSAVTHSPPYDRTHKPAYRIVTATLAEALLKGQKIPYTVV
ncbi:MAG TPA: hypothetical protein PLD47_18625 [Aggregatilineales bacterium]|nr:hypothetical protein [Anaerolineales bacterium]HRE49745.1 hypothetical protein [Aggregatilineales bacterium]